MTRLNAHFAFVDFFSGCGGMSYGFHQIATKNDNFKHVGAFDIDHHANATYSRNFGLGRVDKSKY